MSGNSHLLELYDADDYTGPNPLRATGQGVVWGPEGIKYYILEPDEPLYIDDHTYSQLAVRPNYDGDSIDCPVKSTCTVGIAYSRPGEIFTPGELYGFKDFCFWTVGKIKIANGDDR